MSTVARSTVPDAQGHFGPYGGRFVPETLMHPLQELQDEYFRSQKDPEFQREFEYYLREFCGRPTPLYFAERLARNWNLRGVIAKQVRAGPIHGGCVRAREQKSHREWLRRERPIALPCDDGVHDVQYPALDLVTEHAVCRAVEQDTVEV